MTTNEIMEQADERIERYRKSDAVIKVTTPDGTPERGVRVEVKQTRHEFLFGASISLLFDYKDAEHELYSKRFTDLLNFATLPFYLSTYEPSPGKKRVEHLTRLAEWCRDHNLHVKGHPLVWHEAYPAWGPEDPDEARALFKARVEELIPQYAGLVDAWDVVNEATAALKFDNAVSKWVARDGDAEMVAESLAWARAAGPDAFLICNDYNMGPENEALIQKLIEWGSPFDAVGLQSHMFHERASVEHYWRKCETFARFGKPLHFSEITVLSGKFGWFLQEPWESTPEGEAIQADYVESFYKMLFSHPAVEAATWWDLQDGVWQNAPGGLIHRDLSPKPAYERLLQLIKGDWWTETTLETDENGECSFRGIRGDYVVSVADEKADFTLTKSNNQWLVEVQAQ